MSTVTESTNGHVAPTDVVTDFDVIAVGAGFAGLYLVHRLRGLGLSVRVFEAADDVGGTWYWNRYPGARCDIMSVDYSYAFDADLDAEWRWSEKYATQPEILRYLDHVAERFDLRRDIQFSTKIVAAAWDDSASIWRLRTEHGDEVTCRFYVMATGCLSVPKATDIAGLDRFAGDVYFTSSWPHEGVDFTGKRVGVIGTGSSGVQSIPLIAAQAAELTIFQRTANFVIPAHNGAMPAERMALIEQDRPGYRQLQRQSRGGTVDAETLDTAMQATEEERNRRYEDSWQAGELIRTLGVFSDLLFDPAANETLAEFMRNKIRSIVHDPHTAEMLCPTDHPVGSKRLCLGTNYYETFNLPHVRLINLRDTPIASITETGVDTATETFEFDAIVLATGFDAMTGAIVGVDITGRDGVTLKSAWADGPKTYLGLTVAGFPNLFTVTGPGSPSVLTNMVVSIEQHVDWICECIAGLRAEQLDAIEPTEAAVAGWVQHVNDFGALTLMPTANSWYMGANVPGKPRVFLPYVGGASNYRAVCNEVADRGYFGFSRVGAGTTIVNDGVIRPLQPDVGMMIEAMAAMGLPTMDSMAVADARAFSVASAAMRPAGPAVGEIVDGTLPGAAGDLAYRLYRPAGEAPHPVVAYFHGGGWVLGSAESDDPFCRDLCVRSGAIIVSVDYRHAPEARFPAAADDAFAAVQWIAANAESLGGAPGQLAVAGWSAGANLAAVVCQLARDAGGPAIAGQLLVTPVTDCDLTRASYTDNAEGYMLTTALMTWFWDHYADPAERTDPKASPLLAADLSGLPPALVVTCEFDPLRDEGAAYAGAMASAGVPVHHLACRGQIHTSLTAVDMLPSGAGARAEMGAALRQFFGANVPA